MGERHAAFHSLVFDRLRTAQRPVLAQAQSTYPDRPIRFVIAFRRAAPPTPSSGQFRMSSASHSARPS